MDKINISSDVYNTCPHCKAEWITIAQIVREENKMDVDFICTVCEGIWQESWMHLHTNRNPTPYFMFTEEK